MPNPNQQCAFCGKPIYRTAAAIARSKTGVFWCCRKHRRSWRIMKLKSYRKLAFGNNPHRCDCCGWDLCSEVLEVHHINFDHHDNRLHNLRILCPNCHRMEHRQARIDAEIEASWEPDWEE